MAGSVPPPRRPDRRGDPHPAQDRGVPGVRRAQGGGRALEEPVGGGAAQRLAQRAPRLLPAHRRDRRLRGVRHLRAVLPRRPEARRPAGYPYRPHGRRRHRHPRHRLVGRADRPDRAATGLPVRHRDHPALGDPAVPRGQHRRRGGDRRRLRRQLHRLPELPGRCAGCLVLRAVRDQDPHDRRLPGLPAVGRGLRLHAAGGDRAVRRGRVDGPRAAVQLLRAARSRGRGAHPGDLGTHPARGDRCPPAGAHRTHHPAPAVRADEVGQRQLTPHPPPQSSDPTTTRTFLMTALTTPHPAVPGTGDQTERIERIRQAAYRIRRNALDMGEAQGQGYIGQALGVADVLAVVYTDQLRFRAEDPHWPDRDRFLLSIGHYAIAAYAAMAEAGIIPIEELETYGSDDSRLPMSAMASYTPGMEISGGSLGHGLGVATGMALGLRHLGNPARVFNFLSDGELDEGSTWEAAMSCAHHGLDNVTAIVDVNALQADGPTAGVLRTEPVTDKWRAFGWHALRVDGNDVGALIAAFDEIRSHRGSPSVLICDTRIGCGVPLLESREKAHFMRVDETEWQIARDQLQEGLAR